MWKYSFSAAWKTDAGLVRKANEDSVLAEEDIGLFAVADGMGGHKAGKTASAIAVKTLSEAVRAGLGRGEDVLQLLRRAILASHHAIMAESLENPDYEDMGTTVVAALRDQNGSIVIGHVGDSRAYLVDRHKISPLTQDHSFLAEWLRDGSVSPEAARTHPARHGLYMALGVDDEVEPDLSRVAPSEGSILVLCSDGLSDMIEDHDIRLIIRNSDSLQSACTGLIARANQNGGEDNCTVVLVGMREG